MRKLWSLLARVDSFFITKLENLTQKVQRKTGKDNFHISKTILLLGSLIVFIGCLLNELGIIVLLLMLSMLAYLGLTLYMHEHEVRSNLVSGISNHHKIDFGYTLVRISNFLFFAIGHLYNLCLTNDIDKTNTIHLLAHSIIVLHLYLIACDPLPPCKGKLKEWLKSLFFNPKPITE